MAVREYLWFNVVDESVLCSKVGTGSAQGQLMFTNVRYVLLYPSLCSGF